MFLIIVFIIFYVLPFASAFLCIGGIICCLFGEEYAQRIKGFLYLLGGSLCLLIFLIMLYADYRITFMELLVLGALDTYFALSILQEEKGGAEE